MEVFHDKPCLCIALTLRSALLVCWMCMYEDFKAFPH